MRLSTALTLAALSVGLAYARGGDDDDKGRGGSGKGPSYRKNLPFDGDREKAHNVLIAHGVMASLAFVILFPFGAISIRLFKFPGLVWFHAGIQALAYVIFITAAGLGIYFATEAHYIGEAHPIIGLVLLVVIVFQPFLGLIHHRLFKKHQRRTVWSHGHIWLGRIIITLGIINGGLGLQLAGNSREGEIAYGVIAAIVYIVYIASIFIGEKKRRRSSRSVIPHEPKHGNTSDDVSPPGRKAEYA